MESQEMRQEYVNHFIRAQNLILRISSQPIYLEDPNIVEKMMQLQQFLTLPASVETITLLSSHIEQIKTLIQNKQWNSPKSLENIEEGRTSSYTKVKKSGNAYIPQENEVQDIEVPQYNPIPIRRNSLRQEPDYIFKDQVIRVPVSSSNRGSSHIFMFAFLTFFFETLFLILSLFLYQS